MPAKKPKKHLLTTCTGLVDSMARPGTNVVQAGQVLLIMQTTSVA